MFRRVANLPDWESLPLSQQVAQMVVVRTSGYLFDHQIQYPLWEASNATLERWIRELGVGGVILLGGSAIEVGQRSQQLQDWAQIPLLIAADIEEGVGQRFSGATWFPPPMALGAIADRDPEQAMSLAEAMGASTAQEAAAIGLNWVLAPVVDVNNNAANPVINVRAFGEDPKRVSQLACAFIRGAQSFPVLTSAKHFPGHGDTAIDSHLELPVLPHTLKRLSEVELPPFAAAIAAGVDSVMTAHLHIPSLDATLPATLSSKILTHLLRRQMGFDGLIVTDALIMGAIANQYGPNDAAVLAVEAGADILLMPADPEAAIAAIVEAVETGRIALERIHASLERIWQAKRKILAPAIEGSSSHAWEAIPPPPLQLEQLAQPQTRAIAAEILHASRQVYHPGISRLDYPKVEGELRNVMIVDDVIACPFLPRTSPAIVLPKQRGYRMQLVDGNSPKSDWYGGDRHPTLLQLFIRGNPFRGSAGLSQLACTWFHHLLQTDQLQALVIYGSPYTLDDFIPHLPADVPYVFTYGQMPEAQQIALEELFGSRGKALISGEFTD